MNGLISVKFLLRKSAILNIENDDKNCFLWSILAYIHPCDNNHPIRVSNYKQSSKELNIESFDFNNGFKCSDVQKLRSYIIFPLTFLN